MDTPTAHPLPSTARRAGPWTAAALQAALDALSGQVALVDGQGTVVGVNRAWRRFMTDNGGDERSCGPGSNYLTACDRASGPEGVEAPTVARGLRAVLAGEVETFEQEYPCHSPDEARWFLVRAVPFPGEGGERYAFVLHENITERKLVEIREGDLDTEVAERVLRRTQTLRQEVSELDAFIGSVSHDLRAPLRHILGYLRVLRGHVEPQLAPADLRLLDVVSGAAERLGHMIDELLGLARVSQRPLHLRELDLSQVVRRAWAHLAPETEGREIEWVAGELPTVRGDPELLRLAFENLLSNAIKYTSGRARARIEVGAFQDEAGWVVFVQDDGVGFDARYTHRLFGAFQRLHHERDFAGVGMGLANVRRIVEKHGGQVWATGHPGDGATFSIRFPPA